MNRKPLLAAAVAIAVLSLSVQAQYTPGSGGSYLPPSTPQVPPPAYPSAQQPVYSWETPPQPQLQPTQPENIRIIQPELPIGVPHLYESQIADLTASIALYPDPLLATMLPAATYVEELTYADRWLAQHPGADEYTISNLPIDGSVKAMMHYPTALTLMVEHLDWTQALGVAFIYQQDDVMESVQRWRTTAVSYGTLSSSPQQDVFRQGNTILILPPPRTQVVYVPVYDPAVVYVRPLRPVPVSNYISFSAGGFSLSFIENDLDWRDRQIRVPVRRDRDRDWDRWDRDDNRGGPGGPGRGPPPGRGDGPGPGRGPGGNPGRGNPRGNTAAVADATPIGRAGTPAPARPTPAASEEKTVFVRGSTKSTIMYPQKVVTPQPNKKVVSTPSSTTLPNASPATLPAAPGTPGRGRGRGGDPS